MHSILCNPIDTPGEKSAVRTKEKNPNGKEEARLGGGGGGEGQVSASVSYSDITLAALTDDSPSPSVLAHHSSL